jgi:DNA-binding response OmpR family regulator
MKRRSRSDSVTVLVIDDDPDARRIYPTYLRAKACVVFSAADGRAGIDQAIDLRPDLIVLDLAMPRVDGWTVLAQLRESSWTADIPIIVLTARTDARDEAFRLGGDAYLSKPCPPEVLWWQIRGLLRARSDVRSRLQLEPAERR